jgi:hypothetical protein
LKRETLSEALYDALRDAIDVGEAIPTLSTERPNRITGIVLEGVYVATEKSEREGKSPQLVDAWMLEAAWSYLQRNGSITNEFLLVVCPRIERAVVSRLVHGSPSGRTLGVVARGASAARSDRGGAVELASHGARGARFADGR